VTGRTEHLGEIVHSAPFAQLDCEVHDFCARIRLYAVDERGHQMIWFGKGETIREALAALANEMLEEPPVDYACRPARPPLPKELLERVTL
jgi:hypothetical protein